MWMRSSNEKNHNLFMCLSVLEWMCAQLVMKPFEVELYYTLVKEPLLLFSMKR